MQIVDLIIFEKFQKVDYKIFFLKLILCFAYWRKLAYLLEMSRLLNKDVKVKVIACWKYRNNFSKYIKKYTLNFAQEIKQFILKDSLDYCIYKSNELIFLSSNLNWQDIQLNVFEFDTIIE